jgi:hypothetical protein
MVDGWCEDEVSATREVPQRKILTFGVVTAYLTDTGATTPAGSITGLAALWMCVNLKDSGYFRPYPEHSVHADVSYPDKA